MGSSRGRFVRYWLPVLVWMAAILLGTSVPSGGHLAVLGGRDKLAHVLVYAVLGLLLLRAFRGAARLATPLAAFASLAVGLAYGSLDELHQAFVPTRTCSAADLLADLVGIAAAVLLGWAASAGPATGRGGRRSLRASTRNREMENMADVKELTQADFDSEVLNSDIPCLVDFWAPWCGPCRMVSPIIDKLSEDYAGRLKVGKVNLDEYPELANRYAIRSIPAVFLFKDGEVAEIIIGVQPENAFREAIERALAG